MTSCSAAMFLSFIFSMYLSECICFVCFGQILGLWILECLSFFTFFFLLSLGQVSIPEPVLMYLGYYSKNAVRLSGNVKMEGRSGCYFKNLCLGLTVFLQTDYEG